VQIYSEKVEGKGTVAGGIRLLGSEAGMEGKTM